MIARCYPMVIETSVKHNRFSVTFFDLRKSQAFMTLVTLISVQFSVLDGVDHSSYPSSVIKIR